MLPNGKQLPSPEKSTPATKTAGWPDDPDVKRAKKVKDAEKKRKAYVEGVDDRPLLPSQYDKTSSGRGDNPTILGSKNEEESARPSTLKELGSKNIFSKVWNKDKDEQAPVCASCSRDTAVPESLLAERDQLLQKRDKLRAELERAQARLATKRGRLSRRPA